MIAVLTQGRREGKGRDQQILMRQANEGRPDNPGQNRHGKRSDSI